MQTVMLVEDDDMMLTLLKTLLEIEDYNVVSYQLGDDVLKAVQNASPDLILLDVHLKTRDGGEMNGFDLLPQIRQEPGLQGIKVIISSGLDFAQKSKLAGADGFIQKPYMPEQLIKIVKQTLS